MDRIEAGVVVGERDWTWSGRKRGRLNVGKGQVEVEEEERDEGEQWREVESCVRRGRWQGVVEGEE